MTKCKLTPDSGGIAITCPYDPDFVYELKRYIPATDRRFRPSDKAWLVTPRHAKTLQDICMRVFNELPLLPQAATTKPTITQKIIDVRYIGITKDRGADERSAYGYYKGGWNVLFPETVLRAWFDAPANPDEQPTLYAILNVKRDATTDEIKSGYRRMALQWHPDHSKEPNANEQFLAIQHAYDVLTKNRAKYDAGLALEASIRNSDQKQKTTTQYQGYRAPLRCGLIMCEGVESMGIFQVSKIFAWEDVTDAHGRILVSSWQSGNDMFTEKWV